MTHTLRASTQWYCLHPNVYAATNAQVAFYVGFSMQPLVLLAHVYEGIDYGNAALVMSAECANDDVVPDGAQVQALLAALDAGRPVLIMDADRSLARAYLLLGTALFLQAAGAQTMTHIVGWLTAAAKITVAPHMTHETAGRLKDVELTCLVHFPCIFAVPPRLQ